MTEVPKWTTSAARWCHTVSSLRTRPFCRDWKPTSTRSATWTSHTLSTHQSRDGRCVKTPLISSPRPIKICDELINKNFNESAWLTSRVKSRFRRSHYARWPFCRYAHDSKPGLLLRKKLRQYRACFGLLSWFQCAELFRWWLDPWLGV